MSSRRTEIQGIECLEVSGENSKVGVVFLHGYGANMHDLFPLWELWHRPGFNWYFPNGVQSLPMGAYEGKAWFSIDMIELDRAMREGRHRDMKNHAPPELTSTLERLTKFLKVVSAKHETLIIGGFSQGAMCASHLALREDLKIDGLILLSGALLAEKSFPAATRGLPFYQSHGRQDPVLSVEGAKDLETRLLSLNFTGKLHTFQGGHEIPPSVIQEVQGFLSRF